MMAAQAKLVAGQPKTLGQKERINTAIMGNILFKNLGSDSLESLYGAMWEKACGPGRGETIIKQGDDGDYFYVIDRGKCNVTVDGNTVATLTNGQSFGELALMYFAPRAATITAVEPCILWVMDRVTFRGVLLNSANKKRESHIDFINKVPLLQNRAIPPWRR